MVVIVQKRSGHYKNFQTLLCVLEVQDVSAGKPTLWEIQNPDEVKHELDQLILGLRT